MNLKSARWLIDRYTSIAKERGRKVVWRISHRGEVRCSPVFIFGSQRSGTTMLGKCLGNSPEFENLGETDPRAFSHFFLRDIDTVKDLIRQCRYRFIVFKPLKDSHRVAELLSIDPRGKGIWAFRNYEDRINSAVRQFGRHPLDVIDAFRAGDKSQWQMQGISGEVAEQLRAFTVEGLTVEDGAALMWWIRNSLYFTQQLESQQNLRLWSYDAFVQDPERRLRDVLDFVGSSFRPFMLAGVHAKSVGKEATPRLRPDVQKLCQSLYERLVEASARPDAK